MSDIQPEETELAPEDIAGYVTLKNEMYPEGFEMEIPHLGIVSNYGTKALNVVQIAEFRGAGFEWPDDDHLVVVVAEAPEEVINLEELPPPPFDSSTTGGEQ
jgi:hypothetical protein